MSDLSSVLPQFSTQRYIRLLPSLERVALTTADLLTLDCAEIAKRAKLPPFDVKLLCDAVRKALLGDLGLVAGQGVSGDDETTHGAGRFKSSGKQVVERWETISTLDDELDCGLGGGVPAGYITEVTGESGVGKTQFLLTLLLSAQLPAPLGLASPALYISTEAALPTTRLSQLLSSHPRLVSLFPPKKPSLDNIISIVTPDLESQDHILRFQLPVAIRRHGIRLVILDSVAANYRAEFERGGRSNMAERSKELVELGTLLRTVARDFNVAVVVANQVADRFTSATEASTWNRARESTQSSPLAKRKAPTMGSMSAPSSSIFAPSQTPLVTPDPMALDHQQRWFTGWGDDPSISFSASNQEPNLKTPSLGLVWTTQLAMRIALIKKPVYEIGVEGEEGERGEPVLKGWRRWMKVVFAPHVAGSGKGVDKAVEFEIKGNGIRSVKQEGQGLEDE